MTRSAEPPLTRSRRRKQRRRTLRQIERTERSSRTLLLLAGALLALFMTCGFGVGAFWCVPQPFLFIVTIGLSGVVGLALGGTIRTQRERRALERDDRG